MRDEWILVVEDDEELRSQILIPGLQEHGFGPVHGVGSAMDAYRSMLSRSFSMFVLDIGLPDESGLAIARHVRSQTDAGIVMLTGRRKSRAHQVRGLDEGADAYLTKPVDIELLAATMRSIFRRRRTVGAMPPVLRQDTWSLTPDSWTLMSPRGSRIPLTHGERALLRLLFAEIGRAVARDRIISVLTNVVGPIRETHEFDPHRIELIIHRLRKKAAREAGEVLPLNTIRGVGYVFTM